MITIDKEKLNKLSIVNKSIFLWDKYLGSQELICREDVEFTPLKAIEIYAKKNTSIVEYLRIEMLRMHMGLDESYAHYSYVYKDENPIVQGIKDREIKRKAVSAVASNIEYLLNVLDIPKALKPFSTIMCIHSMDLLKWDESVEELASYLKDYCLAIKKFYELTTNLKCDARQVKTWKATLSCQTLKSTPVQLCDLQYLTKLELLKFKESINVYGLDILSIFAAWYVATQALQYKEKAAKAVTVQQLLQYPVAYDLKHMVTESYIERLKAQYAYQLY